MSRREMHGTGIFNRAGSVPKIFLLGMPLRHVSGGGAPGGVRE